MNQTLSDYIKNTAKIRRLSSPQLDDIESAPQYSETLRSNFVRIGNLAKENRCILEEQLYPYLYGTEMPDKESIRKLEEFENSLLDAYNLENLDPSIHLRLTERLLERAGLDSSDDSLIIQLDHEIMSCYVMVNLTRRIFCRPDIADEYRRRGLLAGERILTWLEKEKFRQLAPDTKKLVLINSRYIWAIYEGCPFSEEDNERNFRMLERALEIAEDPFYREQAPDYDWRYHIFRTLNYIVMLNEYHNERQFSPEICCRIAKRADEFHELWHTDPAYFSSSDPEEETRLLWVRSHYECGDMDRATFYQELLSLYENRNKTSYQLVDLYINLLAPLEYILSLDKQHLSAEECYQLDIFYRNIVNYAFQMPDSDSLSYMLEYFSSILWHFIEVPGVMTFEEMCLCCLAALHPPTYVHTMMVGQITRTLCGHLFRQRPELFSGMPEANNPEALFSFAYHAAICHDFGKIPIIDTIMIYGRKIFEEEFNLIKQHPDLGASMLSRHESTKRYVNVAKGHHKWYDNTAGYPPDFDTKALPEKVIIDLVTCADCLDAATDTVGRSYNQGKTIDHFLSELKEQSGTRYAPYLYDLLQQEAVQKDIRFLLSHGRNQNYINTYLKLKEVQDRGESNN